MNRSEMGAVRASWMALRVDNSGFAQAFYKQLFVREPRLRALVAAHSSHPHAELMAALSSLVEVLDQPRAMSRVVAAAARRQTEIGIKPSHFAAISHALLDTVAELFGSRCTEDVRSAWTAACVLVSEAILAERSNVMDLVA